MSKVSYASVIGSLMYAIVPTQPNRAYVVRATSYYMSNLGKKYWEAVKHNFST